MGLLTLTCAHCNVKNAQFRSVSYVARRDGFHTVFLACNACEHGVTVVVKSRQGHSPHEFPGDLRTPGHFTIERIYPAAAVLNAPAHTPANVANFYKQGMDNLRRKQFDAAGAMCRKAIDVATKTLDATLKGDLKSRIDTLAAASKITPAMKDWGHAIRLDGNEAVHEEVPFSEEDAKQLASFTEIFLMYAFMLPGMLAERAKKAAPTP